MNERVAVVAVHGVAYHEPGSSANAVSGLLLGLPEQSGGPRYGPITAERIHIPLHPLVIEQPLAPGQLGIVQKSLGAFEERTSYLTRAWRTSKGTKENSTEVADDFMRLTLQEYRGAGHNKPKDARDANAYVTTRLKTTRLGRRFRTGSNQSGSGSSGTPPNEPQAVIGELIGVDVYEMYWADLSRPKATITSFFQGLYQLLFHFASLSRLAISTGYLENRKMWQWRALDRLQVYAVRMLTLPIPVLNMILLATIFGIAPRLIPQVAGVDATPKIAGFGTALLGIVGFLLASRFLHASRGPLKWMLYPLAVGIVTGGAAYWISLADPRHILLSCEGLAIGAYFVYKSVTSYDEVRDGAKQTATVLGAACVLAVFLIWTYKGADSIQQAVLWAMQVDLAALRLSWILLFAFAIFACIFGALAWRGIDENKEKDRRSRARAAVRTSRFALALPTLGILIVTLALWSGLLVKTRGAKGQYGDSIAVHLFGTTIKTPLSGGKRWQSLILNDQGIIPFLDQPSATFTVTTTPVSVPTPVDVSASYQGQSETARLMVNPSSPTLTLSPATVIGGNPATATVALDDRTLSGPVTVNVKQSTGPNSSSDTMQRDIPFPHGLAAPSTNISISTSNLTTQQPNEYFQGLLVWSVTPGFPLTLALLISVLFLLALWLLPSIYTENGEHVPVTSSNDFSRRMGNWLSRGLDSSKFAVGLAWCAGFVVPIAFVLPYNWMWMNYHWIWTKSLNYSLIHLTTVILEYMGIAVTSAAVLAGLAGSGSSVLGIILDVDNYLRTSPADETPRARIMERYVSLLRYLSDYKDPIDGKGYDRIVIVAHSLGALISADLLRFLKVQSASPTIEVRLFTMGNPLRQLLNRFFPYLYEWVHPIPDNSLTPLLNVAQPRPAPVIPLDLSPDPNLLGVSTWLSAYRSGDYVGRSLWLDEWYDREVSAKPGEVYVASEALSGPRQEMCIGAGAHQHYWDQSAPDIAEKLDTLILS